MTMGKLFRGKLPRGYCMGGYVPKGTLYPVEWILAGYHGN